ncbi:MAG: WXG100 family type VII secretion target [Pirellulaceae bacterium]|jgi:uncharacterized protein YukE|nr:WXG100 family type VII secretion target [Planctomycetaceae bacterium]HIM31923.1 WXG100 family type VII secretion target [Planctomycetota bacterium]
MPQAIVDPDEMRQFARNLKKFNAELRDRVNSLHHQMVALGSSWRDQEHRKFLEMFEQQMSVMMRFTEDSDEHVPYLMRKAEHIENYLQS